jgi:Mrp family chromosome partitioning ATPase
MSAVLQASSELQNMALRLVALAPASIVITSAHAGEGKTFIAAALARYAALTEPGGVLLVDANFERPALGALFGCAGAPGFSEAIAASGASRMTPCATPIANLHVLPAGAAPRPELLFHAAAMRAVLAQLCERHALVLIDAGTTSTAAGVATCASGLVLVADCQRTRREAAAGALARLGLPAGRVLGAVLNRKAHYIPEAIYRRL